MVIQPHLKEGSHLKKHVKLVIFFYKNISSKGGFCTNWASFALTFTLTLSNYYKTVARSVDIK